MQGPWMDDWIIAPHSPLMVKPGNQSRIKNASQPGWTLLAMTWKFMYMVGKLPLLECDWRKTAVIKLISFDNCNQTHRALALGCHTLSSLRKMNFQEHCLEKKKHLSWKLRRTNHVLLKLYLKSSPHSDFSLNVIMLLSTGMKKWSK